MLKKIFKFSALIACGLALVGFILMMATPSVVYLDNVNNYYSGVAAIFGKGPAHFEAGLGGLGTLVNDGTFEGKLAVTALLAWIFVLVAMLVVCASFVISMLKVKVGEKVAAVMDLVVIGLLLVGGVLMFFTVPAFFAANEWNGASDWGLGAGWIIGAILVIAGGVFAALPVVSAFMGKKK